MALQALASRRSQYVVGALCALVLLHRLARAPEVLRADTSTLPFGAASNLTAELRALNKAADRRRRRLSAELQNAGEASGKLRLFRTSTF